MSCRSGILSSTFAGCVPHADACCSRLDWQTRSVHSSGTGHHSPAKSELWSHYSDQPANIIDDRQPTVPVTKQCLGSNGRRCAALLTSGSRCPACFRTNDAGRGTTTARGYGSEWQRHSKQAIATWRHAHGDTCPGWGAASHPSNDLVTDHDLGVMCRSCNSRKAATADKQRAAQHRADMALRRVDL